MKGKINVICAKKEFTDDQVKAMVVLKDLDAPRGFDGTAYSDIEVRAKQPISRDSMKLIAITKGIASKVVGKKELITLKDCPCEFVYRKAKDEDRWYYCIIVELGNQKFPYTKKFFLNNKNEIQLSLINTGIEFTKDEELIEGINEEMDDENPNGESNI